MGLFTSNEVPNEQADQYLNAWRKEAREFAEACNRETQEAKDRN